ncbi:dephospho-CoA kinase [Sediminicola arcticus]|jgi:dephospho-CoA kinase|uniref:Dephospho-CoA kinase n=1 Tax=Sediminicola arcticus TaxID=1574308 RepID=A0ABV2SV47_9FLAO
MKLIGLTGGIGSGKSTVAEMFATLGVPVYNSDAEAKLLMTNSNQIKKAIVELFGNNAYVEGVLNRDLISKKVFLDKGLLNHLNAIVHPAVREHFESWVKKQDYPYVIQEAAIIFENGIQDRYDAIVLVTAPKETRLKRVLARDNVSEKQVLSRMDNQWDEADKMALATYTIKNIDLEETKGKVQEIHQIFLKG